MVQLLCGVGPFKMCLAIGKNVEGLTSLQIYFSFRYFFTRIALGGVKHTAPCDIARYIDNASAGNITEDPMT